MIDLEKIGKRILEERKYLHRISQEKMAEDLGMYQADISNLEKAKSGSGITDIVKLDMIADYFGIPLETLLFGRRNDHMEKYYGMRMRLKEFTKKRTKKHESLLCRLMGISDAENKDELLKSVASFECGPYMVYAAYERQIEFNPEDDPEGEPSNFLVKAHIYVVYQDEVIGCMVADITAVMQHVFQPAFEKLKTFIMPDVFDLDETLTVLNPYWLMYQYAADEEEEEEYRTKMLQRMDQLRAAGEMRTIYYIENAYVQEDCRRNGIFRMMLDVLKKFSGNAIIWLNLEPTSGDELSTEYSYMPAYKSSELGQLNMNASIAERLGFTIDAVTADRQAERLEEDGSVVVETVPVRRTAYYLPKKIRNILNGDGDLKAYARARRKAIGDEKGEARFVDIYHGGWKKYGFIVAIKLVYREETVFAFARGMDWKTHWMGVSRENPAPTGAFVETMEKYDRLSDAEGSKYYPALKVAEQMLGAGYFATVDAGDIQLDALQR